MTYASFWYLPLSEDNGIDTILLQFVELVGQCLLHRLCSHALELTIYTLDPCAAHLTFGLGGDSNNH